MKETIFKYALKALSGISGKLAEFVVAWFKDEGSRLAWEWSLEAFSFVAAAGKMNHAQLNVDAGQSIGAARREWVFARLKERAKSAPKEVGSSVLNTAIELAVARLKSAA